MEVIYHVFLDGVGHKSANKKREIPFLILTEDEAENTVILDTYSYCVWKGLPKGRYTNCEEISSGIVQGLRVGITTKREILYSNYTI